MKRLLKQRFSGASLIEVLVATLVVGLVLTSIAFLMSLNVKSSNEAELRAQASVFAQQGVDRARSSRANNTWTDFVSGAAAACTDNSISFAMVNYKRTCTLNACPSGQPCQRLSVIVCWPRPAGNCTSSSQNKAVVIQDFYNR